VHKVLFTILFFAPALLFGQRFSATPLTDFQPGETYFGYPGLLYDGSNTPTPTHDAAGRAAAALVQPLDTWGTPSPTGKIVVISMGESHTTMEWCDKAYPACAGYSFIGLWRANKAANHDTLAVVDGASAGRVVLTWTCPTGPCPQYALGTTGTYIEVENQYDRVLDTILTPNGYTEAQVQVAVFDEATTKIPDASLKDGASADAFLLEEHLTSAIRAAQQRWPNLKMVFVNSRCYAGYGSPLDHLSPEPQAYEGGFAIKWAIHAQANQRDTGEVDPVAGDMLVGDFPWIGWTAYIWGNGMNNPPKSTALTWSPYVGGQAIGFYQADNVHPNHYGISQVANRLHGFFMTSPYTPWFRK
jgi:hypothetical protein